MSDRPDLDHLAEVDRLREENAGLLQAVESWKREEVMNEEEVASLRDQHERWRITVRRVFGEEAGGEQ